MAKRIYTENEIIKAKELIETLDNFTNYDIQCVVNYKVTDKNRLTAIIDAVVSEFGSDIMNNKVFTGKLFAKYAKN